jgi:hypothetical protein
MREPYADPLRPLPLRIEQRNPIDTRRQTARSTRFGRRFCADSCSSSDEQHTLRIRHGSARFISRLSSTILFLLFVVQPILGVAAPVMPVAPLAQAALSSSAALLSQTITFGALPGKTYGDSPFAVVATASSGLPVAFTSLTTAVCTIGGSTVSIVAAGTCTIRASQAGDATYGAAPSVNQTFIVAKKSQTITFSPLPGKTYSDPPFAMAANASSALPVTFASTTTGICTVSGSTATIVAAGTCTIRASQAGNANYSAATSVSQSFTVAKKSQTITFAALPGRTYGDPPFAVSATASSALTVSFSSRSTSVCTVSGTTVTIAAPGTCTIRASQAGSGNYLPATSVDRIFTVAKKSQAITFGALTSRRMDQSPSTLAATASSGLPVSFLSTTTTTCTVTGSTVTLKGVGTCTIQAVQTGNGNFLAATPVNQGFAVSKGSQTIAFTSLADKTLSDPPFTVTATASSALSVLFTSLTWDVCSVSGSGVTLLASGSCTVRAYQPGNSNWMAAPPVDRSFSVVSSQTIAFVALSNQPLGAIVTLNATASSGLPVSFASATPATCSITDTTVKLLGLGVCTVRASQAGNLYYGAAPTVDQSFNVLRAQTITFAPISSKPLGTPSFSPTATASSGLPVTLTSRTPTICSVSGNVVTLATIGSCTVRASQAGDAIYASAPDVDNTFNVTPAPSIRYFYDGAGNMVRIERN